MDLLAEVELFEKVQGDDPLKLVMEALLVETNEPASVPTVDCDSNLPDLLHDIGEDLSGETEGPVPAVEFDANIPDSFLSMMLEAMPADSCDMLPAIEEDWGAITPDSLLEKLEVLEVLQGETAEPISGAQEPQVDPHSLPSPPTHSTVPAEPVFHSQPQLYKNVPFVPYPQLAQDTLVSIGMFNGEVVYALPPQAFSPAFFPTAPPLNTSTCQKTRMSNQKDESRQSYIKKPPNAFMVYRQEQRCRVVTELNVRDCAVVNKELGRRWKDLPEQEKAKYYEEAHRLRRHHEQLYPEWSPSDNYGKKKKRIRRKCPIK